MPKKSLTTTLLSLILSVVTLVSGLAALSLVTLNYSVDDAKAINASGSLRMRSYQLVFYTNSESELLREKVTEFEEILASKELMKAKAWYNPKRTHDQYDTVVARWKEMQNFALNGDSRKYVNNVKPFVAEIDQLVDQLESQAENKILLLLAMQIIGVIAILGVGATMLRMVRRRVLQPLHKLEVAATSISHRDFQVDLPHSDFHELQTLSDTFKQTASELEGLYHNLEQQVAEKTQALAQANAGLTFLYQSSLWFHRDRLSVENLTKSLADLQSHTLANGVRLECEERPDLDVALGDLDGKCTTERLVFENQELGTLEVYGHKPLPGNMLHNYAIIVARGILLDRASSQRELLSLMEERGIIARELHDSMGQVLAYMKIQTSLLKRAIDADNINLRDQALNELTSGTNQAYQQLRELLGTFRLTIAEKDLELSLEQMLEQLQGRTQAKLKLQYDMLPPPLTGQQHVHLLQLCREAVINAIKHSQADAITLKAENLNEELQFSINDTGVGIANLKDRDNHYGIGIMHERAHKLGGRLDFCDNPEGGLCVKLTFNPTEESLHE